MRYLITDLHLGTVLGTNVLDLAYELSYSEDHFVVYAGSYPPQRIIEKEFLPIKDYHDVYGDVE